MGNKMNKWDTKGKQNGNNMQPLGVFGIRTRIKTPDVNTATPENQKKRTK
jgi:hypothetical protein